MTNKLENLLQQKQMLSNLLKTTNEEIIQQQIIRPEYLNHLGFRKIEVIRNTIIYEKRLLSDVIYIILLDLERPNLVRLQRDQQDKIYGFEIDTVEEFKGLLLFLNLL